MHHPNCDVPPIASDADSSVSAVFSAFMRAAHAQRQLMARKMSARGISPAQMFCLREVGHDPGITQRDLAEKLNVSRPTLTVMLHKMEKSGLIERRPDESDQRYTRIYLADGGARAHDGMHEIIGEVTAEMVGPMPETDQAELVRLLTALADNMMDTTLESPEKADR